MNNIGFDQNIRRLSELSYLYRCVNSIKKYKYSKKLTMKILQLLLLGNENYQNRTNSKFYISLTAKEIAKTLNKKESEVQSILDTLSHNYNSMYGDNNQLVGKDKNLYFYKGKENEYWNKMGFFFPSLGTVNINYESIAKSNGKLPQTLLVAICALASNLPHSETNLTFRYKHIENICGITPDQFKSICKENNFDYRIKFSDATIDEKRITNVSNNNRIRGIYFTDKAIKNAKQLLGLYSYNPDYKNLFLLGEMFYTNVSKMTKDFFMNQKWERLPIEKDVLDLSFCKWTEEIYKNAIKFYRNISNQDKLYYVEDSSSCTPNSKKAIDLEIKNSNIHKKEYYDKKYKDENVNKLKDDSPSSTTSETKNEVTFNKTSYQDFCYESRERFSELKKERKTVFCVFEIIKDYLEKMDNELIKEKLESIKTIQDILRSPMFTHPNDVAINISLEEHELKGKWYVEESLINIDTTEYLEEIEFFDIINDIKDDFSNPEDYVKEEAIEVCKEKFKDLILCSDHKDYVKTWLERADQESKNFKRKKRMKECFELMSPVYLLHKILGETEFKNVKDLKKYIFSDLCHQKLNGFKTAIYSEIKDEETRIFKNWINNTMIDESIYYDYFSEKFRMKDYHIKNKKIIENFIKEFDNKVKIVKINEERQMVIDLVESLGMKIGGLYGEIDEDEANLFEIELIMGLTTIDDIRKNLLGLD